MWQRLIDRLLSSPIDLHRIVCRGGSGSVSAFETRIALFQVVVGAVCLLPFVYALYSALSDPHWTTWAAIVLGGPPMVTFGALIVLHKVKITIDRMRQEVTRVDRFLWWSWRRKLPLPLVRKVLIQCRLGHDMDVKFSVVLPGMDLFHLVVFYNLKRAREVAAFLAQALGGSVEDQTVNVEAKLAARYGRRLRR